MTDISYWDDTLQDEIQAIGNLIDRISNSKDPDEKAEMIERCKNKLRNAAGTKRSFKMEIRLVQDVGSRRNYEARLQQLDQELQTYQADLKALESELNRSELFDQADTNNGMKHGNEEDAQKGGDKMLADAMQIQEKTQDSLENTKKLIAEAKEVGVSTLEELQRQREVLHNIERETDRLDDNLQRAEKLLKQFGKRMAGDQFIQCFAVVNVLLFVIVILYAVVKKKKPTPQPSNPASTDSTATRRQLSSYVETKIQDFVDYLIDCYYDQNDDSSTTTTTFFLRGSDNTTH